MEQVTYHYVELKLISIFFSALAIPRIMIAILEKNQIFENGILKVEIPKVLQPFMGNLTEIRESN